MRSTRNHLAVTLTLSFMAVLWPTAGGAAGGTSCVWESEVVASPGVSSSPSSGTVKTNGEDGPITCQGSFRGKSVTGPGKTGFDGRYGTKDGDTCASGGEGDGKFSVTIPTSNGAEHAVYDTTFSYGAFKAGGAFSGEIKGDGISATFDVTPEDGDCVNKPVTRFHVKGKGMFS